MGNQQCKIETCENNVYMPTKRARKYYGQLVYCSSHMCKEPYCGLLRTRKSPYCESHKCCTTDCLLACAIGKRCSMCYDKMPDFPVYDYNV